jgi:hypothetical protein
MAQWRALLIKLFFIAFAAYIGACSSNSDEALVADAQSCLNRVPLDQPQAAYPCLAKVENLDIPSAHQIRCSGSFILQGFSNPSRLTQIAEQLAKNGSGNSGQLASIGLLAFTGPNALEESQKALTSCQKAGSKGMAILASMSNLATLMNATLGGAINTSCTGANVDPQNCSQAVKNALCSNSGSLKTELGTVAIYTYNNVCRFNPEADPMCSTYATATQNGAETNAQTVGQNLVNHLTTCP